MAVSQVASADAIVAELHLIHGKVLVSKVKGYMLSGSARTDDRILVGRNGSAILTLANDCDVQLQPCQVHLVPEVSPFAVSYQPPPQQVAFCQSDGGSWKHLSKLMMC